MMIIKGEHMLKIFYSLEELKNHCVSLLRYFWMYNKANIVKKIFLAPKLLLNLSFLSRFTCN